MTKFLIAGLGNIGEEYRETRHNIGFKIAETLAAEAGADFVLERHAMHCTFRFKGKSVHLIKPTTYMNESGKAIKYWLNKLEIPNENLLVIVDDIALPFGVLRIRSKGSDGGHNGLTSVQHHLDSSNYPRMRFGIEGNFSKGKQVKYVLGEWSKEEKKLLTEKVANACNAVKSFMTIGIERTMTDYNKVRTAEGPDN